MNNMLCAVIMVIGVGLVCAHTHTCEATCCIILISANLCMLNGRLGTNNFTCISHKGRSVVDYCFVPYEQLGFYNNFQVITMTDAVEQYSLSVPDRLPDH